MDNYYLLLQIDPDLSHEDLVKEFNLTQKKWLNRQNAPNLDKRQEAEKMLSILAQAEKILLNETSRRTYDLEIIKLHNSRRDQVEKQSQVPNRVNERIFHVMELISQKQYASALQLARSATEIDPSNPDTWATLSLVYYKAGKKEEAISDYRRALKLASHEDIVVRFTKYKIR